MSAEFRFRVDDEEHDPGRVRCSGCRVRMYVRPLSRVLRDKYAFAEDTDQFGRKRYWCRDCTAKLYAIP